MEGPQKIHAPPCVDLKPLSLLACRDNLRDLQRIRRAHAGLHHFDRLVLLMDLLIDGDRHLQPELRT